MTLLSAKATDDHLVTKGCGHFLGGVQGQREFEVYWGYSNGDVSRVTFADLQLRKEVWLLRFESFL